MDFGGEEGWGWIHEYLADCPMCQDMKTVSIIDPPSHGCCLQECHED
jgi:hypothetical protein